ncbi:MAG: hypothetical protein NXI23_05375 [Bacteroidetes bacterium]|nr:hypothetical protein [Bacteroidota bacterium]
MKNTWKYIITLICFFSISMTYAQSDEYDNLAWLDLGLNINNVGPGVHAGITTNYNLHLYSFNFSHSKTPDVFWLLDILDGKVVQEKVNEFSCLYGLVKRYKFINLYGQGGVGMVTGEKIVEEDIWNSSNTREKLSNFTSFGFSYKAGLDFVIGNYFGLGIATNGNLNKDKPITGIIFSLKLGVMR